jgi:hypothetical protein
MKYRNYLIGGGIIAGGLIAWYIYRKVTGAGTPYENKGAVGILANATNTLLGGAPQAVGETLSRWTYDILNGDDIGETTFYTVTFPDGTKHAIGATTVSKSGAFAYNGKTYTLYVDASGKKFAK